MLTEDAIRFILRLSIYHHWVWSNAKVHAISTSLDIRLESGDIENRVQTHKGEARSIYKQLDQSAVQHRKDQSTYDSIYMNHSKPIA